MSYRLFFLCAALACTLTACGGGDAAAGASDAAASYTPPGPGECSMVSNADASAALGMPVTFTPPLPPAVNCNLESEPTTYGSGIITKMEGFDFDTYLGNSFPSATPVEVEGLGDRAVWIVQDMTGDLLVQHGSDIYAVGLTWNQAGASTDAELHRTRAVALARAVLSNV